MKKIAAEFFRRGLVACGFGPLVLAVLYLILRRFAGLETLGVEQVCTGIFSLAALAFIAGGMNVVYQLERLPLMAAVAIHGLVLYISYLATFLLNDWLARGKAALLIFTLIFVLGYLAIWAVIYCVTIRRTRKLNEMLKKQREQSGGV